jgi:hypothetical protein
MATWLANRAIERDLQVLGATGIGDRIKAWSYPSEDALLLGYKVVAWNIAAEDWLDHDTEWMVNKVLRELKPGSVILFHDALFDTTEDRFADREPMLSAVDILLDCLSERYRFVTIPELFRYGRPQRRNWYGGQSIDFLYRRRRQYGKGRLYSPQAYAFTDVTGESDERHRSSR